MLQKLSFWTELDFWISKLSFNFAFSAFSPELHPHTALPVPDCSRAWRGPPLLRIVARRKLKNMIIGRTFFTLPWRILSKSAGFLPSKTPWPINCAIQPRACAVPIRKWAPSFVAMKSKTLSYRKEAIYTLHEEKMDTVHPEGANEPRKGSHRDVEQNCQSIDC